ncbi:sulfurtransferase TusA family protein [Microvirga sp. W0021]|uniref:Sulfurtransferase TusA family protein n=1 Tax=Hohaiivirga grylli TaxID=3133970 RepID=A0ABV0BK40_9HYPH
MEDKPVLDLTGLKCPLPALRVRKKLIQMQAKEELRVICTDPMAVIDIPNTAREQGAVLLKQYQEDGRLWFHLQKID